MVLGSVWMEHEFPVRAVPQFLDQLDFELHGDFVKGLNLGHADARNVEKTSDKSLFEAAFAGLRRLLKDAIQPCHSAPSTNRLAAVRDGGERPANALKAAPPVMPLGHNGFGGVTCA
jgi:hypothetical protein